MGVFLVYMGKVGHVLLGQTDWAGMGDISSGRMSACLQV